MNLFQFEPFTSEKTGKTSFMCTALDTGDNFIVAKQKLEAITSEKTGIILGVPVVSNGFATIKIIKVYTSEDDILRILEKVKPQKVENTTNEFENSDEVPF